MKDSCTDRWRVIVSECCRSRFFFCCSLSLLLNHGESTLWITSAAFSVCLSICSSQARLRPPPPTPTPCWPRSQKQQQRRGPSLCQTQSCSCVLLGQTLTTKFIIRMLTFSRLLHLIFSRVTEANHSSPWVRAGPNPGQSYRLISHRKNQPLTGTLKTGVSLE